MEYPEMHPRPVSIGKKGFKLATVSVPNLVPEADAQMMLY